MSNSIHKTTVVLGSLCLTFAVGTGWALWQLHSTSAFAPSVAGATIGIGMADSTPAPAEHFNAASALLWDTEHHRILFQQNAFADWPIASLTKLMTAMVAVDTHLSWTKQMTIKPEEYTVGGNLMLSNDESVSVRDLFNASLLGSANNATLAYVRGVDMDQVAFIETMNRKAVELGLEQTHFLDITGLNPHNTATAYDAARLLEAALRYPDIAKATSQRDYDFIVGGSGREHVIKSTNKLVAEGQETVGGSKTGYLDESKYNLMIKGTGIYANRIAVIFGSPSQEISEQEVFRLLKLPVAE